MRLYVGITCPHCNVEFVELPLEHVQTSKASRCKQHLDTHHKPVADATSERMTDAAEELRAENARLTAELAAERAKATALVAKESRLVERNDSQGQRLRSVEEQLERINAQLTTQSLWQQAVSHALGLHAPPIPHFEACVDKITKMCSGKKRLREQLSQTQEDFKRYRKANEHTDDLLRCMSVFAEHPEAAKAFLRRLSKHAHPDKHRQSPEANKVATGMQKAINYLAETL
jgi:hypothetical protein